LETVKVREKGGVLEAAFSIMDEGVLIVDHFGGCVGVRHSKTCAQGR
jgi:hypothetical protein